MNTYKVTVSFMGEVLGSKSFDSMEEAETEVLTMSKEISARGSHNGVILTIEEVSAYTNKGPTEVQ